MKLDLVLFLLFGVPATVGFIPAATSSTAARNQALYATQTQSPEDTRVTKDWVFERFNEGMPDEIDDDLQAMNEGAKYHVFDWYSTITTPEAPSESQQVEGKSIGGIRRFVAEPVQPEVAPAVDQFRRLTHSAVNVPPAPALEQFQHLKHSAVKPDVALTLGQGPNEWFSDAIGLNPAIQSHTAASTKLREHAEWFTNAAPDSKPDEIPAFENLQRLVPSPPVRPAARPSFEQLERLVVLAAKPQDSVASLDGVREYFSDPVPPVQPKVAPVFSSGPSEWFSQAITAQ